MAEQQWSKAKPPLMAVLAVMSLLAPTPAHAQPTPTQPGTRESYPAGPNLAVGRLVASGFEAALDCRLPLQQLGPSAFDRPAPLDSAVTTSFSASEIQSLPVSGRQWSAFVLDSSASSTPASGTQTSLRGAGYASADLAIDGASIQFAFAGAASGSTSQSSSGGVPEPAGMGQAWAGGRNSTIAESAIRQVSAIAGNVEAQGARASAGRMSVQSERGSNDLHGQIFFFDRQNNWGARNPFTQWVQQTAPATAIAVPVFGNGPNGEPQNYSPPDHEMTSGIGMGGRIRRDKLFWFAALDTFNHNDPGVSMVKHPYLCPNVECSPVEGFFAQPTNDQIQLLGAQLGTNNNGALAKYSQMLETLDGLLGPAERTASQLTGFARLDWQAAERHSFSLESTGAEWNSPGGGVSRTAEIYGNHSYGSSQASQQFLLARWEAYLTPNLLAVTQGSTGRTIQSAHAGTPSTYEQTLNQNAWGQLPQIVVDSRYGFTIGNPARFGPGSYPDEKLFRLQESLDWVHGKLLIRAGAEVGHNADTTGRLRNQTGTYYYSTVANFISDALAFGAFGYGGALDKFNPHNCDQTGKVWRDSGGELRGLGSLPCYSYYSQVMGPSNWHLSTNDWAGFATAQWQPHRLAVFSTGLRWEREQLPPPIAAVANQELPLTGKLPALGNNWGPRASLAFGGGRKSAWPVLRIGYGLYFGRVQNATLLTALTQTGSTAGDMNFFMRPTDNLNAGGAPPFPYVLAGEPLAMVKPGAVQFAPNFRGPQVHQAIVSIEQNLPGHIQVTASGMASLGRHLPISVDTNFDTTVNPGTITAANPGITYAVVDGTGKGPIKAAQITVPFYATWPSATSSTGTAGRLNPDYQQISEVYSRANSTYEAASIKIVRSGRRGLNLHAHYTYAHAMDWNPNESSDVSGSDVLDPASFNSEYGTSNLDVRHSASVMVEFVAPWRLRAVAGDLANGWTVSGTGNFRSGLPYTMRTSGSLAKEFNQHTGAAIVGLGPGMNGSGGDNRVYGKGSDGVFYDIGRNTFRYPSTWKADMRVGKNFSVGEKREVELMAESYNLFNHQNVTELETTGYTIGSGSTNGALPTLNFLTGLKANTTAFGQPLSVNASSLYRERQIQFGLRLRF